MRKRRMMQAASIGITLFVIFAAANMNVRADGENGYWEIIK